MDTKISAAVSGAPGEGTDSFPIGRAGNPTPLRLTLADILTYLKTVDGAGSGLDADLLDGLNSAAFGQIASMYRALNGLEPEKLSTNVLRIQPGSCANSDSTKLYATSAAIDIDISTTGVNGRDTGTVADGEDYFPYLIANNTTGALAGVVSAANAYGGVTVPAGYTMVRKLPFGFVYHATNWDGIPDFHLSYWPKPFVRLTRSEEGSAWRALSEGAATIFTSVDLSPFMPDNARMAYLLCRTSDAGGSAGSAQIRVLSTQTNGVSVGATIVGGASAFSFIHQRVTSARGLEYKISGGARLSIFVLGYSMAEPS